MCFSVSPHAPPLIQQRTQQAKDAWITAFALAMIALCIVGISGILMGYGTLPPAMNGGMGFVPYLIGYFLNIGTLTTVAGALVFFAIGSVRLYQARSEQAPADL